MSVERRYLLINLSILNILKINKNLKKKRLLKYFNVWKYRFILYVKLNQLKDIIEIQIEKKNSDDLLVLNNKYNNLLKENSNLSSNIKTLNTNESNLKNLINKFNENEKNYKSKIKMLNNNKEKYNNILQNNNNSNNNYAHLENKIKNLENNIIQIEDENKERNLTINKFLKDMDKILDLHQQKCN